MKFYNVRIMVIEEIRNDDGKIESMSDPVTNGYQITGKFIDHAIIPNEVIKEETGKIITDLITKLREATNGQTNP